MLQGDRSGLVLDRKDPMSVIQALTEENEIRDEWADYVPDPIVISEDLKQELRKEFDRYLAEQFEEFGEPSPEEMAQSLAFWRPIEEHLKKNRRGMPVGPPAHRRCGQPLPEDLCGG